MGDNPEKIAAIMNEAGVAFVKLGSLASQLHPNPDSGPHSKWTNAEMELFQSSIKKFSNDLNSLSETIKTRTVTQIQAKVKEEMSVNKEHLIQVKDEHPEDLFEFSV